MIGLIVYDKISLKGKFLKLSYGKYNYNILINNLSDIRSLSISPYTTVSLYSNDNCQGTIRTIVNNGKGYKKIMNIRTEINISQIQSISVMSYDILYDKCMNTKKTITTCPIIEETKCNIPITLCDKKKDVDINMNYCIIKGVIEGECGLQFDYTLYKMKKIPKRHEDDKVKKLKTDVIIIIGDLGIHKSFYEQLQYDFAVFGGYSSLIINLGGVGESSVLESYKYEDIVNNFYYVYKKLFTQYEKRKECKERCCVEDEHGCNNVLPLNNIILVGHGFGGAVAQHWALTHDLVKKLVLINSAPYKIYNSHDLLMANTNSWLNNLTSHIGYANVLGMNIYTTNENYGRFNRDILEEKYINSVISSNEISMKKHITDNIDVPSEGTLHENIGIPTLIIQGTNNKYIDKNAGDKLDNIENSQIMYVCMNHHMLFYNPDLVYGYINAFIKGCLSVIEFKKECKKKCKKDYLVNF